MNIYEIDSAIVECIDMETGEIIDTERLDALMMARQDKLEGVALWVKNMTAEAEAVHAEAAKLTSRERSLKNKVEQLKAYLQEHLDGDKLTTPRVKVSYRTTEQLDIEDEDAFMWFLRMEHNDMLKYEEPTIRKKVVKEYIQHVGDLPGVKLMAKKHIIIS